MAKLTRHVTNINKLLKNIKSNIIADWKIYQECRWGQYKQSHKL